jgi:trehalose 6-phosphate phosphatase
VDDEDSVRAKLERIAADAEERGLIAHWGRKVLEIRPPVQIDKGSAIDELARRSRISAALYAGDDTTDLDGFDGVERIGGVKVGVASEEGPPAIVERADLVVDGPEGMLHVLESL